MKRLSAFVLLVVMLDFALGAVLDRLYARTLTGERGGVTNYALGKDAKVLILGSSRAQFHLMPRVLEQRLSLPAYNAGLKGHDLLYAAALLDLWKRRHGAPRALVLTVDPETMVHRESEVAAAQLFGPYIDQSDVVRDILYLGGPAKRFEYLSRAYRYNGKVLPILKNLLSHPARDADGFLAADGTLDPNDPNVGAARHGLLDFPPGEVPSDAMALGVARREFWPPKVRLLASMMDASAQEGTLLLLVHTPVYNLSRTAHDEWLARMKRLVGGRKGVEVLDLCEFAHPREFANRLDLYHDFAHLNGSGALVLSTLLADELERRLSLERPATAVTESSETHTDR